MKDELGREFSVVFAISVCAIPLAIAAVAVQKIRQKLNKEDKSLRNK